MNHSFSVEIAEKFGIEKAVILENFYFWIRKNKANKKNIHEGRCYSYNTAEAFAELFPYIKERRIAQLLREMESEDNLLLSGQFFNYDRTKSYTLTDFALSFFESSNIQKFDNGTSKNCMMENQDSVDCLNTDINTDVNPNINTQGCVPAYVSQPLKITQSDYQTLVNNCFLMIAEHNKSAIHKIPISKAIMYFTQKEGRQILSLCKEYDAIEIQDALKNFLASADVESWKSSFSFNAFCNNISEYLPEYFDISKYTTIPKNKDEVQTITDAFAQEHKNDKWFDLAVFHHHREDWMKAGKPEGADFEKWSDKVYAEDEKNGRLDDKGMYL